MAKNRTQYPKTSAISVPLIKIFMLKIWKINESSKAKKLKIPTAITAPNGVTQFSQLC